MPGRSADPALLAAAHSGRLTRANTARGTVERQAVYAAERQRSVTRARASGLSRRAAYGHARVGEPTRRDLLEANRHPGTAPLDVLRRAVLAHERAIFKDPTLYPKFSEKRARERLGDILDRETLVLMFRLEAEEWAGLATAQIFGNPFFYH